MRASNTGLWAWVGLCLIVPGLPAVQAQDPADDERLLKTAFVYNFAKFTRWPPDTWTGQRAPLNLCTLGSDELVSSLGRLGNETIGGRPVVVKAIAPASEGEDCHVLFIASSEQERFARWLARIRARPVLTISEIRGFADAGGMIQLYRADDRIRFRINLAAARAGGLRLSARLLDLAELVDKEVAP